MTKAERDSLMSSLEYLIDSIASERGSDFVDGMLKRMGIKSIYTIPSCDLWEVYGEFHQVEADLK